MTRKSKQKKNKRGPKKASNRAEYPAPQLPYRQPQMLGMDAYHSPGSSNWMLGSGRKRGGNMTKSKLTAFNRPPPHYSPYPKPIGMGRHGHGMRMLAPYPQNKIPGTGMRKVGGFWQYVPQIIQGLRTIKPVSVVDDIFKSYGKDSSNVPVLGKIVKGLRWAGFGRQQPMYHMGMGLPY